MHPSGCCLSCLRQEQGWSTNYQRHGLSSPVQDFSSPVSVGLFVLFLHMGSSWSTTAPEDLSPWLSSDTTVSLLGMTERNLKGGHSKGVTRKTHNALAIKCFSAWVLAVERWPSFGITSSQLEWSTKPSISERTWWRHVTWQSVFQFAFHCKSSDGRRNCFPWSLRDSSEISGMEAYILCVLAWLTTRSNT